MIVRLCPRWGFSVTSNTFRTHSCCKGSFVSVLTRRCSIEGVRAEIGPRVEPRVQRDRSPQPRDRDPQSRGAGARGESFTNKEHERRGSTGPSRGGLQKLSRCSGPFCRGEGTPSATNVRAIDRPGPFETGQGVPRDAVQGHGEGVERPEGQAGERQSKYNQRDREHIESGGADLPVTRRPEAPRGEDAAGAERVATLPRVFSDTRRWSEQIRRVAGERHQGPYQRDLGRMQGSGYCINIQNLREKANAATESSNRQSELIETTVSKMRSLEDERANLESKVRKMEAELTGCELSKESLRREKQTFATFLDRLGKAMQMDEISEEMGLDLQTESLLVRAEQLARLETDKLVDKYLYHEYTTLPRIRRERSFHELSSMKETSVVYQLQRRVRTLREQLQRRDLHLDLLRRKLSLQEDSVRMKSLLQTERDEANLRSKKLSKQIDRLQIQLSEEKSRNRELGAQLTEAADYKIAALERSRKIEELQKRLVESEMLRTRCNRKLATLKEQMRSTTETAEQERSINDHSLQLLRSELAQLKQNLAEITKRESQLQSFRVSVVKLLSEPICTPDYEIVSRLQKMVAAHRDFTMLSRRYDEPLETSPSRCTSVHPVHPPRSPGSRCTRYEDSGFADPPDLRDIEEDYNKRPIRSSLLP
ncbi:uncharacterized protein LOC143150162 isoform X5 [Ptiloglossa arizonensis]|uniref:uncharacterized protein LOC143150162 isoform X5 n=1 Tax=Ptiloglossa arizonensis TaxID=3350558 RepID=UPI003F9FE300